MAKCNSVKVMVTQKHIREGEPDDPEFCPIALAVREALEKLEFPSFANFNVEIGKEELRAAAWAAARAAARDAVWSAEAAAEKIFNEMAMKALPT